MPEITKVTMRHGHNLIEGELLVVGDDYVPYDFRNWQECCNFLIDKCYGMRRAMILTERDKEHLEMRCPLTGEYLTVLGSTENLEHIHKTFILQNLYRPYRRSQ